jgi:hypothetical protein
VNYNKKEAVVPQKSKQNNYEIGFHFTEEGTEV